MVLSAIANAVHWLQFSIISGILEDYYDVSPVVIAWTAMMFSVTFVIFVFPSIWLIERVGLKNMLISGDILMIIGAWLKLASMERELFYCGFAGQIIVGMAQVAIVNVPSYLAGLWFPSNEVSTASAIGVIGTQVGVALGILIPPILVSETKDTDIIRMELSWLYVTFALMPTLLLPLIIFVFKDVPLKPPSYAQLETLLKKRSRQNEENPKSDIREMLISLLTNVNYLLVVTSYSLILATYYCISTLLELLYHGHFQELEKVGVIGTVFVVASIFGILFYGWILDKTHKFKLIAIAAYCFSLGGLGIFWLALNLRDDRLMFVSVTVLGLFLASYVAIAIEFSSEMTYPISETISTSILLSFGEFLSVVLIFMSTELFEIFGELAVILTTTIFMLVGFLATLLISSKGVLKRYEASARSPTPSKNAVAATTNDTNIEQPTASIISYRGEFHHRIMRKLTPFRNKILVHGVKNDLLDKRKSHLEDPAMNKSNGNQDEDDSQKESPKGGAKNVLLDKRKSHLEVPVMNKSNAHQDEDGSQQEPKLLKKVTPNTSEENSLKTESRSIKAITNSGRQALQ
ncbi:hypothetical protein GE061_014299 [Apolygus lucorum]|uniref:Major facilitator superfamily (MFS) profile domain-containing protein n=1 Tax=Apolygus lucorum TaxID=248454 RepID=A0A8S9XRD7_APOLU|nr:hypothetical protein GE061_014299 [Apolygus lucorum]